MVIYFVTGAVLGALAGAGLLHWRNTFSVRKKPPYSPDLAAQGPPIGELQ